MLLVKSGDLLNKTVKDLKKYKDIEFLSSDIEPDQLELRAAELKKNFVCTTFGEKILVIDYDNVDKDIDDLMEKNRIENILK